MTTNGNIDQDKTATHVILAPGVTVDHYRILRRIGAGGMGEVYLAEDTAAAEPAALKFLSASLSRDALYRRRFLREVQAAARLNHQNIVGICDTGEFESRAYFAMPFIEGSTIRELIDLGQIDQKNVPDLVLQICAGLQHAHDCGIVHRDIKPTNIIVDRTGHVMLLDFGLARIESEDSLTVVGTAIGTARYMSPEQAEGRPVDHRSDIFSLGTVLYELLTGVSPFSRGYEPAAMYAVVHERPKPLRHFKSDLDENYQVVIDRAMAKKPERRYPSMASMAEDIERVRDGQPLAEFASGGVSDVAKAVPSLAVMYFRNLGDRNDEYLAYGLTEDLIVDLSRVGDVRVTPMRTALKYRDTELDLDEIADRLRVGRILDGSVRKTGDTVHVAAQLIDVATGQTIWSDRRDEPVNNLPRVKTAFSEELIKRLGAAGDSQITSAATTTFYIPAAYEFFLRGKYAFEHRKDRTDVHTAMGLFRKALDLDPSLIAARAGIARILIYNAEYQQAEEVLNEMLSEARSRGLLNDQAVALHLLGRCQALVSRYDEARENLRLAIRLSQKQRDIETELMARTHLLMTYRMLGQIDGTKDEYDRVVQLAHRLDDPARAIDAIGQMGWINLNVGKTTEARSLFDTGLALARESENRAGEANMLNSIAACYVGRMDRQSMRTELDYFRRAGEIWRELGDERNAMNTENNVGWVYRKQGQFREALRAFELATSWMGNQGKNKVYHAVGLATMAETLCFLGEYDRSAETAEKAVAVAREIGHEPFQAFGQIALARTRFLQGNDEEAIRTVEEAVKLAEKHSAEWEVISGRCVLGEMLFEMNQRDKARQSLQQVTRTAKDAAYDEFLIRAFGYLSAIQTIEDGVGFGRARLNELVDRSADSYIHVIMMRLLGLCHIERPTDEIDREEGRRLLRKALAAARQMLFKPEIDRIQALLNRTA